MSKQVLVGVGIGVVVAAAVGAIASYSSKQASPTPVTTAASVASVAADAKPVKRAVAALESTPANESADPSNTAPTVQPAKTNVETTSAARPVARVVHATVAHATVAHSRHATARSVEPSSTQSALTFGRVLSSTAVVENQRIPRQDCHDEQVTHKKPVKDEQRIAASAIGAVIGGILGNQVGDGNGRTLATAAGAVAGGVAGNKIQQRVQDGSTETVTEKRCVTVYDIKEKVRGYDVVYRVGNDTKTVRMAIEPQIGSNLPLRDGRAVTLVERSR